MGGCSQYFYNMIGSTKAGKIEGIQRRGYKIYRIDGVEDSDSLQSEDKESEN